MKLRGEEISVKHIQILFIVWSAFVLTFMCRLAWPPIMPLASKELGMTAQQAGSFMTAFYIGYVITQLPGGLLTDRFGYRKVLLCSLLAMGGTTMLMGATTSYQTGFIFRVLTGISTGSVYASGVRAIFDWFPPKSRGAALGIYTTATSLGLSLVNLFVPTIAKQYNWKFSFIIAGALCFVGMVMAFFMLHERNSDGNAKKDQNAGEFFKSILSMAKNRNLVVVALSGFCVLWATWGLATWANTYLNKGLKLTLVQAGAIMSTYGLAALICKPVAGIISDFLPGKRKALLFIVFILFAGITILFGMNTKVNMLYILTPVLGVAAFVYTPILNLTVGESVPPHLVGTATGFTNTIWQLGALIAPLVAGTVIDATNSYFYGFLSLAIGPAVGAIIILFLKEKKEA